jgi:hypothetical protein
VGFCGYAGRLEGSVLVLLSSAWLLSAVGLSHIYIEEKSKCMKPCCVLTPLGGRDSRPAKCILTSRWPTRVWGLAARVVQSVSSEKGKELQSLQVVLSYPTRLTPERSEVWWYKLTGTNKLGQDQYCPQILNPRPVALMQTSSFSPFAGFRTDLLIAIGLRSVHG